MFSPNSDEINDTLQAFNWKFIDSIELVIYNRWGTEVYRTEDRDFNWDGTEIESGEQLSDGVYFYTLIVNTIRLEGIVTESYSGEIQIFDSNGTIDE